MRQQATTREHSTVRTQLAQQLAYLLQRVRDGEASHADRGE